MTDPKALADAWASATDTISEYHAACAMAFFLRSLEDRGLAYYDPCYPLDAQCVDLAKADAGKRVYVQEVGSD